MKTNRKLNCYLLSNLIISFLSLNLLVSDNSTITTLNSVHNSSFSKLNKIYEIKEEVVEEVEEEKDVTTISVTKKEMQTQKEITYIKPSYNSVTGNSLVEYAKHYLGLKYVSGGNSLTTGTDCSGFTKLIYKEFGINLGRTVNSQIYNGSYVSKNDLMPGDLVFYGYSSSKATHVAIYMGSGLVIHESNPNDGVKINSVNMMVYITARRVITANIEKVVEVPGTKEENIVESETSSDTVKEEINKEENSQDDNKEIVVEDNESNDKEITNQTTTDAEVSIDIKDENKVEVQEEVVETESSNQVNTNLQETDENTIIDVIPSSEIE